MPSTSKKQARLMAGVAHSASFAKKVGIPQNLPYRPIGDQRVLFIEHYRPIGNIGNDGHVVCCGHKCFSGRMEFLKKHNQPVLRCERAAGVRDRG